MLGRQEDVSYVKNDWAEEVGDVKRELYVMSCRGFSPTIQLLGANLKDSFLVC